MEWCLKPRTSTIAYLASFISSSQTAKHLLNSSITLRSFRIHSAVRASFAVETQDNYYVNTSYIHWQASPLP